MNRRAAFVLLVGATGASTVALAPFESASVGCGPGFITYAILVSLASAYVGTVAGVSCALLASVGFVALQLPSGSLALEMVLASVGLVLIAGVIGAIADGVRWQRENLIRKSVAVDELREQLRSQQATLSKALAAMPADDLSTEENRPEVDGPTERQEEYDSEPPGGGDTVAVLESGASDLSINDVAPIQRLLAAIHQISGSLNEPRILASTVKSACELVGATRVVIHLHERKTDRFLQGVAHPPGEEHPSADDYEKELRRVLKSREPFIRDPDLSDDESGIEIIMPLFDRAMLTGFLVVFGPLELRTMPLERLSIVSSACGLALSGARLARSFDKQARLDPHTGLAGAEAIRELAREKLARGSLALILIAADDLRRVNEDYGRRTGDKVFASLARLVTMELAGNGEVGRYGGASLLIVLPGYRSEVAGTLAHRIVRRVRGSIAAGPEGLAPPLTLSASVGAASVGSIDPLLQEIECGLAAAIAAGGDRVVLDGAETASA